MSVARSMITVGTKPSASSVASTSRGEARRGGGGGGGKSAVVVECFFQPQIRSRRACADNGTLDDTEPYSSSQSSSACDRNESSVTSLLMSLPDDFDSDSLDGSCSDSSDSSCSSENSSTEYVDDDDESSLGSETMCSLEGELLEDQRWMRFRGRTFSRSASVSDFGGASDRKPPPTRKRSGSLSRLCAPVFEKKSPPAKPPSSTNPFEGPSCAMYRNTKPRDMLKSLLELDGGSSIAPISFKDVEETYFVRHTKEQIASYDMESTLAVRRNDLGEVRRLHESGRDLQACNQFGETIIHIVARRGRSAILKYLVKKANCSLRVCCDFGRTPLHDACWNTTPNFVTIKFLIEQCPEFLFVADIRGFTPLDYVPKDCWGPFCSFLTENRDKLRPPALPSRRC